MANIVAIKLDDQGGQEMSHSRPIHARRKKDLVVLVLHRQLEACCSPYP
jgi:hypothetical protein